jgi:hypothetical protein
MSREEVERFMAQRMQNQDVQYAHGLQQQLFAAQQRIAEPEEACERSLFWIEEGDGAFSDTGEALAYVSRTVKMMRAVLHKEVGNEMESQTP